MNYSYMMVRIKLESKVGERGQVVIPKPLRDQFNIGANSKIVFETDGEKLILRKKITATEQYKEFVSGPKYKLGKIDWDTEYHERFG